MVHGMVLAHMGSAGLFLSLAAVKPVFTLNQSKQIPAQQGKGLSFRQERS